MARLPQPGGDAGNWGDILNDYLVQSHKADGSIKDNSVGSAQLQDNAVTAATLAPNSVTSAALASDSVTAATITDGSITEPLLASAVQTKLNAPATIGDGSVTNTKIAADSVSKNQLHSVLRDELDEKLTRTVGDATYAPVSSGVIFITHGDDVSTPRGAAPGRRIWIGTVTPTAFLDGVDLLFKPTDGATAASPPSVPTSGLISRWTSHEAVGSIDGLVTSWPAAAGAVPLTLNGGPTLRSSGGRKYVELDGINDYLSAALGSTIAQPNTVMVVGRYAVTPPLTSKVLFGGTTGGSLSQTIGTTSSDGRFQVFGGSGLISAVVGNTDWHLHHALFNNTTSNYSLDGASIASGPAGTNTLDGIRIGTNSAISTFYKLEIAEILVWSRALTVQEKSDVSSALIAYYGI